MYFRTCEVFSFFFFFFTDTAATLRNGDWYRFDDEIVQRLDSVKVHVHGYVYGACTYDLGKVYP